ncbi:hypothetical protein DEM27_28535 [Metarhizobium album]|uniref:Uncharacterized protein n=1 Tax=Metarhizobium album TaxID=2182425 RepID=A0A2U2DHG7_9HYPH|nr:hypothetical protein DEM27_28535 [Rhizobium album]
MLALSDAFEAIEARMLFARAFRAIAGLSASDEMRNAFLGIWENDGESLRSNSDDLSLIDGLRVLLPVYTGPGLKLYRGCSWPNRCRRTYGMSWSSRLDVATAFAESRKDRYRGGSVLLEAYAPPKAIICALALFSDRYDEAEYVVDRRRLLAVKESWLGKSGQLR